MSESLHAEPNSKLLDHSARTNQRMAKAPAAEQLQDTHTRCTMTACVTPGRDSLQPSQAANLMETAMTYCVPSHCNVDRGTTC